MNDAMKNARLSEDLQLRVLEGGPVHYEYSTDKPVEYVTVADEHGRVLGYLWGCDADDAAGWVDHQVAGRAALQAAGHWVMKLRNAKSRALLPSQALAELSTEPGAGRSGQIVPGSQAKAESVEVLRAKANEGWEPPAQPESPRGRRR
ncbi:hypothetical protein ACIRVF_26675 [Kitasatospora sp. NPDC101157]|uniref:hypothetical protein n=1 Tax=Kitasatospora sp. NPDC101157 TaxID=3364098 RepID=UPI00380FABD9